MPRHLEDLRKQQQARVSPLSRRTKEIRAHGPSGRVDINRLGIFDDLPVFLPGKWVREGNSSREAYALQQGQEFLDDLMEELTWLSSQAREDADTQHGYAPGGTSSTSFRSTPARTL